MATIGAQITANGIQVPDYADVLAQLQIQFWQIYGSDADLDPDSADGQWVAVLAQIVYDAGLLAQAAYQGFSPTTAQGTQLSSLVKLNGLRREISSSSTVDLTLGGVAGTVVFGGIVGDDQNLGTQWLLPNSVTIGSGGTVDVTATCSTSGAVTAGANTLTQILTPTQNWQTVTNSLAATPGAPVETDAALRTRQSQSTSIPAQSVLDSIYASVSSLSGVQRVAAYENDTDTADSNGAPPHCIYLVVSGGSISDITSAIAVKKTPGTRSYGTTSAVVIDQSGVPNTIGFYQLTNVELIFQVTITPLSNYVSTTAAEIQAAVAAFVNVLAIGENSYLTRLYVPALLNGVGDGTTYVVTGIQQAIKGNALGTADITILFNQAAFTTAADVTVVT